MTLVIVGAVTDVNCGLGRVENQCCGRQRSNGRLSDAQGSDKQKGDPVHVAASD